MRRAFVAFVIATVVARGPVARPAERSENEAALQITVYQDNFALVKDRRVLPEPLKRGANTVRFRDVAATIDATSVHFRSLTDPDTTVIEQNFDFALVNAETLLEKYIDHKITAYTAERPYEGYLMSFDGQRLVLAENRETGPIYLVERGENIKRIVFPSLPEGLLTRPTLVWEVTTQTPGRHTVEVSYIASQIRWRADYNLVIHPDDSAIDLSGWVTLENKSGTDYRSATVKLLAGDTRAEVAQPTYGYGPEYYKRITKLPPTERAGPDPSRVLGDYRVYELEEPTTANDRQVKQIEILKRSDIPANKTYIYDGAKLRWNPLGAYWDPNYGREENKKVNVILEFENRANRNLGVALPKGKCRVYQRDTDGALEFIGEDTIDHTARDEKVALYIGDAFDIVGERKQTDFRRITNRVYEEAFEITIRNHKDEAVTVKVLEKLYRWSDWTIRERSHDYEKVDSRTIIFPLHVEAGEEVVCTYRVRYQR